MGMVYTGLHTVLCERLRAGYAPPKPDFHEKNILQIWRAEIGKDTPTRTPEMMFWDRKPLFYLIKSDLAMF